MSTPVFLLLFAAFGVSAVIIFINITGEPGIDYWDLDGSNEPPASRLDFLRTKPWLFGAGAVLVTSFIAYLVFR